MDGERAGVKGWHEGTKWHEGISGDDGYVVYLHCGDNLISRYITSKLTKQYTLKMCSLLDIDCISIKLS